MQNLLMIEIVKNLLDKTHGVILSCNQYNSAYVWAFCLELMGYSSLFNDKHCNHFLISFHNSHSKIYLGLFKIYKQPDVVLKILGIWASISKVVLDRLPDDQKQIFFGLSSDLFEAFRAAGHGNRPKRNRKKEEEDKQAKYLSQMLQIITDISEQRHTESAMRAFHGISAVINALTKEMLAVLLTFLNPLCFFIYLTHEY